LLLSSSRGQLGLSRRSNMAPWDGLSPEVGSWQKQIQCRCGVGLFSARKDDQDDVSSPCQVNDRVLGQLGNVGRRVLDSPQYLSELSYVAKY